MNTIELITKKRNKATFTKEEIQFLVSGYNKGKIPDYQFSALLMAIFLNGMTREETAFLTGAMIESGKIANLSSLKGIKIGKHSTGGVGDKTSFVLSAILASEGVFVPQTSGRGLGHTGGTLDKLDSIPGFKVNLSDSEYKKVLQKTKAAFISQTATIAPADKPIYALRDATATVESIPLITASIMSKKIAEGTDGLVLDIKTGTGAFMQTMKESEALALSLMNTAKSFNRKVIGFITEMSQPLGYSIGNSNEIIECIELMQGKAIPDLWHIVTALSSAMLLMAGKVESLEEGIERASLALTSGKAMDSFISIVQHQGGNVDYIKNTNLFPKAKYSEEVFLASNGYVEMINGREIGLSSTLLGAGRLTKEDTIDHSAGIEFYPKIGTKVSKNEPIATIKTNNKKVIEQVKQRIADAVTLSKSPVKPVKLIKKILY